MHIPDSMLHGSLCPVTALISSASLIAVSCVCIKSKAKPTAMEFASVSALVFAGQMVNFPILHGSSGHLLGGVLAAGLLGTPFAVLSLALVVSMQSLLFSDGGATVLGTNILNMALIGAGLGGIIHSLLSTRWNSRPGKLLSIALASWLSIVFASFAASIELAIDGQSEFFTVSTAMLSVHALIGIGEALLTITCLALLPAISAHTSTQTRTTIPIALAIVALLLSPFASSLPDGLEWVAAKYNFLHQSAPAFVAPFPDYSIPMIHQESISTGIAGLVGVLAIFSLAWLIAKVGRRLSCATKE